MTGDLTEGAAFGDYRVVRRLGKGGMGSVWLLENATGGQLAAKILDRATAEGHEARRRFLREAELALGVKHPNLVETFDVGEDPETGLCYILMEYVPCGTLADRLRQGGALPIEDAVAVVRAMANVLELGRQKGIVHRDIKPANIMFDENGTPKLTDLGIARGGIHGADTTTVTHTGMMIGTPAYMSPEQMLDSHKVDSRADIYSLGVVFFEMLTGERPNKDDTVVQLMAKAMKGAPLPNVRKLRPEVPAALANLLSKMVKHDKADRIATPGKIVEALDAIECAGKDGHQKPQPLAWLEKVRTLPREIVAPAAVLAGLVVFFAILLLARRGPEGKKASEDGFRPIPFATNVEDKVKIDDAKPDDKQEREEKAVAETNVVGTVQENVVPGKTEVPVHEEKKAAADGGGSTDTPAEVAKPKDEPKREVEPVPAQTNATEKTQSDAADRKKTAEPKPRKADKTQSVQEALDKLFPGWKTTKAGGSRELGYKRNYAGVDNVLCAHQSDMGVPVTFSKEVKVTGTYPVLHMRLSGGRSGCRSRLCVKVNEKIVREMSITGGWKSVYVNLAEWRGQKVWVAIEQSSETWTNGWFYWAELEIADDQVMAERAREQTVPADGQKKDKKKKATQNACGQMFPGWRVMLGESECEQNEGGRGNDLVVYAQEYNAPVALARQVTVPSMWQFPKPELKMYVTMSGGVLIMQIKVNGIVVSRKETSGGWQTFRLDLSAWEGKSVFVEIVCTPKAGRAEVHFKRIEIK